LDYWISKLRAVYSNGIKVVDNVCGTRCISGDEAPPAAQTCKSRSLAASSPPRRSLASRPVRARFHRGPARGIDDGRHEYRPERIHPAVNTIALLIMISDKQTAQSMQKIYDTCGISPDRIANIAATAIDRRTTPLSSSP